MAEASPEIHMRSASHEAHAHTLWRETHTHTLCIVAAALAMLVVFAPPAAAQEPDGSWPDPPDDAEAEPAPKPATLSWSPGLDIPAGYHKVTHPRWGAVAAGSVVFGLPYAVAAASAGHGNPPGWSAVPLVGPFVEAVGYHCTPTGEFDFCLDGLVKAIWVTLGIEQIAGAALILVGVEAPITELELSAPRAPRVAVRPLVLGARGAGLGLEGAF
jgi:hypothetical protein